MSVGAGCPNLESVAIKILFIWHAAPDPHNQQLFREAVRTPGVEILVLAPPEARERMQVFRLRRPLTVRWSRGSRFTVFPARVARPRNSPGYHVYLDLARHIRRFQPDIIHVAEEATSLVAAQTAFLRPRLAPRALFTMHIFQNVLIRLRNPWPAIEKYVLSRLDAALTSGPGVVEVLRRKGFTRPVYLRTWGADAREFRPGLSSPVRRKLGSGPPVIGWAGRMFLGKGLHILLRASKLMKRPHRLLVVGTGPREAEMHLLAEKLGIGGRITWAGAVDPGRVRDCYAAMDVFTHPTISCPPDMPDWKEQFAKTQIEAMLCGLPVVSTTSGDNAWGVGEGGIIVRENNPGALARALDRLCASPGLRRSLGKKARARGLAEFTWKEAARGMLKIWGELLEKRAGNQP